ncbi:MAG: hypothetical protein IJ055_07025 [Oscillospiraceae bacterium]|nr:hypothetical protein [Oscillospiraceae bacterium]
MKRVLRVTGRIVLRIGIALVSLLLALLAVRLIGRAVNSRTPDGGINETRSCPRMFTRSRKCRRTDRDT